ncbi:hypothetical protein BJV74DRAFT_60740 [Russula compacta]|nr:hypothetical protein BJV74DRAFT_60740 [Russula compacta]
MLKPLRLSKTTPGTETQQWTSERSYSQDSPRFKMLALRRPSDSSSALSSTPASFLSSTPDGVSPSDPSPVLPLTPHTSAPLPREPHDWHPSSSKEMSGNNRAPIPSHTYTDAPQPAFGYDRGRLQAYGHRYGGGHRSPPQPHRTEAPSTHGPAEAWDKYGTNYSSSRPVRPW